MDISFEARENILTISLGGNLLGEQDSAPLIELVERKIKTGEARYAVFDLEKLDFVNSTGLAALLTCMTKFRNAGGDVCLVHVGETLAKLLSITKLDKVIPSCDDVETAVERFQTA